MILFWLSLMIAQSRVVESIVPALHYSRVCTTTVEARNLGDRAAEANVEAHRESGALVAIVEQPGMALHLAPGEARSFTLKVREPVENAWVAIRERVPDRALSPVIAVSGTTACAAGEQAQGAVLDVAREVAHAAANPWFDGDVGDMPGARVAVVNTSETTAVVSGCYSSGTLVANPNVPGGAALRPLCTRQFREQIPPLSARQYAVMRDGNSHFLLRATGRGIALQMLRVLDAGTQLYRVDSSVSFGSEVR